MNDLAQEAIDEWVSEGLEEVTLPSGRRVRGVSPSPLELMERKLLPTELRTLVAKYEFDTEGIKPTELSDEEMSQFARMSREMARAYVRDLWFRDQWVSVEGVLSEERFKSLPDADRAFLASKAMRSVEVAALTPFPGERPEPANREGRREVARQAKRAARSA